MNMHIIGLIILVLSTMLYSACGPRDETYSIAMNVDTLYFSRHRPFQVLAQITLVNNQDKSVFVKRNDYLTTSLDTSYNANYPANIFINKYPIPQDSIEYGCYAFAKEGLIVDEYYRAFYALNDNMRQEVTDDGIVYILEGKSKNVIRIGFSLKPYTPVVIRKLEAAVLHPRAVSIKLECSGQSFKQFKTLIVVDSCITM